MIVYTVVLLGELICYLVWQLLYSPACTLLTTPTLSYHIFSLKGQPSGKLVSNGLSWVGLPYVPLRASNFLEISLPILNLHTNQTNSIFLYDWSVNLCRRLNKIEVLMAWLLGVKVYNLLNLSSY